VHYYVSSPIAFPDGGKSEHGLEFISRRVVYRRVGSCHSYVNDVSAASQHPSRMAQRGVAKRGARQFWCRAIDAEFGGVPIVRYQGVAFLSGLLHLFDFHGFTAVSSCFSVLSFALGAYVLFWYRQILNCGLREGLLGLSFL
jgi:hypothetical protein